MTVTIDTPWVLVAAQEIRQGTIAAAREYTYQTIEAIAELIVKWYNWEENLKIIEENIG